MNNCKCAPKTYTFGVSKTSSSTHPGPKQAGHPHAELMAQYAEDAKTSDKPWELWERRPDTGVWAPLACSPSWNVSVGYRRKPEPVEWWVGRYPTGGLGPIYSCREDVESMCPSAVEYFQVGRI